MIMQADSLEEELATITLYSALLGEWLVDVNMQDQLSTLDILLWWSRSAEAEA
jgi:hypothetical protein